MQECTVAMIVKPACILGKTTLSHFMVLSKKQEKIIGIFMVDNKVVVYIGWLDNKVVVYIGWLGYYQTLLI